MRIALLLSAALLGLGTATAFAQGDYSRPNQGWNAGHGWNEGRGYGSAPAERYVGVPPASAYRGGAGAPFSREASNIDRRDTRSVIAPRLPSPGDVGDSTRAYLRAAERALEQDRTGVAQVAIGRAMTRFLNGAMDAGMGYDALSSDVMHDLVSARQALAANDLRTSHEAVATALDRLRGFQG